MQCRYLKKVQTLITQARSQPSSLVQLPKTAIAVSDDIAIFGDIVPCPIAENGDILENSVNT